MRTIRDHRHDLEAIERYYDCVPWASSTNEQCGPCARVSLVFLSAASDAAAEIYRLVGCTDVGTARILSLAD